MKIKPFEYKEATGRLLSECEMQFYSWCQDERTAVALAKVATLPKDATVSQIELVAIEVFVAAMVASGHEDCVKHYQGTNYDYRRLKQ